MPITQDTDKDDVRVKGDDGSDGGRLIGTVDDCLKVSVCTDDDFSGFPTWAPSLRYEDMGPSVGGVSRDTNIGSTFTNIYNVTGSGLFGGFFVTVEKPDEEWYIRLTVDGNDIFNGTTGLNYEDFDDDKLYGYEFQDQIVRSCIGFATFKETLCFDQYIKYTSSIAISLRKAGGSKKFRAGLVRRSI